MHTPGFCAAIATLILCAACGDSKDTAAAASSTGIPATGTTSKSGTASTKGSVEGHTLAPKWAAFVANEDNKNGILVVLSSQENYCSNVAAGITTPNHVSIGMTFNTVASDATTPAPTPGTYPIVSAAPGVAGNVSLAAFNVSNSTCATALTKSDGGASSGSAQLTAVSSTSVSGSFSMTVDGEEVTGQFEAVPCAALAAQISSNKALTCQQGSTTN